MSADPNAPLWDATSEEPVSLTTGDLRDDVDVAIVGGGYTGLSCALHAAELGLSVQVFEAALAGAGGSGRNVGLVNAGSWLPPAKLRATLGPTWGNRFLDIFGAAPDRVFTLIERHQIRCAPTRSGTIHAAHARTGLRDLRARHAAWRAMDAPLEMLDAPAMQAMTGSSAFGGGLLDHRAGTLQPMGYVRGLARAAQGAGARIRYGCPVTSLTPAGAAWRVETAQGLVQARKVVLATNAYTDGLWPGLDRVFTRIHYLQLATEPLGDRVGHILPGQQGLWDTARIMTSLRKDAQGRLILGSMGRVMGTAQAGPTARWAQAQLQRLFPGLGPVRFEKAWDGKIAMTSDHIPRLCQLAPGVYTAIGYNGRGITTGTVLGAALAQVLAGGDPADLPLPVTALPHTRFGRAREAAMAAVFALNQHSGGRLGRMPV